MPISFLHFRTVCVLFPASLGTAARRLLSEFVYRPISYYTFRSLGYTMDSNGTPRHFLPPCLDLHQHRPTEERVYLVATEQSEGFHVGGTLPRNHSHEETQSVTVKGGRWSELVELWLSPCLCRSRCMLAGTPLAKIILILTSECSKFMCSHKCE